MAEENDLLTGPTWQDLLGPTRRAEAEQRMNMRCWIGTEDPEPWVSPEVDRECLEMAYVLLALISPVTAPGCDREAMIVYGTLSALLDTGATKLREFSEDELLKRNFRGRPVEEWAQRAAAGLDEWTRTTLLEGFRIQIAQLKEIRVESGPGAGAARYSANATSYPEYIRWRTREGWYWGGLLACAVISGIDLREVPTQWIEETLEASVLAFDIHGSLRHAFENEVGHTLHYLPGTQHEKVTACLNAYNEILFRLQDAEDLTPPAKEYLLRFITGLVGAAYACRRYNKTTPLHVARPEDIQIGWTHIDAAPTYRQTFDQVTAHTRLDN
ncbi:hypothetical protein [Streptomyces sp. NBC_01565]|uniref:hypothetical protein n=1 Tax=unclassified Streptomyces TaxID=2593676 RepID=UPI00224F5865|nr:hypothetical protein [Streptomyces sp. NBC_01565]MCX4546751.1 hypothetical protein [Streptomyces sp. NBC_01565]